MNHRIAEINDYLDLLIQSNDRTAKAADEKGNKTMGGLFRDRVMLLEVVKKDINFILRDD
jgi:hypothetical protein